MGFVGSSNNKLEQQIFTKKKNENQKTDIFMHLMYPNSFIFILHANKFHIIISMKMRQLCLCQIQAKMSHVTRKSAFAYANNKGADQPAHPRSRISTFVVRWLDSIIFLVSISKISSLYIAPVAAQAGLNLTWSETPKTGFLVTKLK